jgi:hypothetical protein
MLQIYYLILTVFYVSTVFSVENTYNSQQISSDDAVWMDEQFNKRFEKLTFIPEIISNFKEMVSEIKKRKNGELLFLLYFEFENGSSQFKSAWDFLKYNGHRYRISNKLSSLYSSGVRKSPDFQITINSMLEKFSTNLDVTEQKFMDEMYEGYIRSIVLDDFHLPFFNEIQLAKADQDGLEVIVFNFIENEVKEFVRQDGRRFLHYNIVNFELDEAKFLNDSSFGHSVENYLAVKNNFREKLKTEIISKSGSFKIFGNGDFMRPFARLINLDLIEENKIVRDKLIKELGERTNVGRLSDLTSFVNFAGEGDLKVRSKIQDLSLKFPEFKSAFIELTFSYMNFNSSVQRNPGFLTARFLSLLYKNFDPEVNKEHKYIAERFITAGIIRSSKQNLDVEDNIERYKKGILDSYLKDLKLSSDSTNGLAINRKLDGEFSLLKSFLKKVYEYRDNNPEIRRLEKIVEYTLPDYEWDKSFGESKVEQIENSLILELNDDKSLVFLKSEKKYLFPEYRSHILYNLLSRIPLEIELRKKKGKNISSLEFDRLFQIFEKASKLILEDPPVRLNNNMIYQLDEFRKLILGDWYRNPASFPKQYLDRFLSVYIKMSKFEDEYFMKSEVLYSNYYPFAEYEKTLFAPFDKAYDCKNVEYSGFLEKQIELIKNINKTSSFDELKHRALTAYFYYTMNMINELQMNNFNSSSEIYFRFKFIKDYFKFFIENKTLLESIVVFKNESVYSKITESFKSFGVKSGFIEAFLVFSPELTKTLLQDKDIVKKLGVIDKDAFIKYLKMEIDFISRENNLSFDQSLNLYIDSNKNELFKIIFEDLEILDKEVGETYFQTIYKLLDINDCDNLLKK